VVAKLIRHA
jgi:hypothetical protein